MGHQTNLVDEHVQVSVVAFVTDFLRRLLTPKLRTRNSFLTFWPVTVTFTWNLATRAEILLSCLVYPVKTESSP